MEKEIINLLKLLENLEDKISFLNLERDRLREEAIPENVRQVLREIDEEFAPQIEETRNLADKVREQIKNLVLEHKQSVSTPTGRVVAIFRKGPSGWDTQRLRQYAEKHPEINSFITEGQPSVIIKFK